MTAEVAVLNSTGVALAADSAVTIGNEKIYNSALKLFALSKTEPVGIMIYGNAALMEVPWETIIKIFRTELGTRTYASLEEYSEQFFVFLSSRHDFFTEEVQKNWFLANVRGYFGFLLESLIKKVELKIKKNGKIDEQETKQIVFAIIGDHNKDLTNRSILAGMSKTFESELRKKYRSEIKQVREEVFKGLTINRSLTLKLGAIAAEIHTRDVFSQSTSGIVVAGFGINDIYPVIITHEVEGVICDKVKSKKLESKSVRINSGAECSVIPFAQDDMVASFMNGVNPSVQSFVLSYLSELFKRLPELIDEDRLKGTDKDKKDLLLQYSSDIQSLLHDFFTQLGEHTQREHVQPIMQMVSALPKDELAAMAESLVNLTAFKRRMTRVLETVGGPIDVAIISKGDGFVWIKRKHYFPAELNQHFFANYHRGV